MSKSVPWKVRVAGYAAAKSIQAWMSTLQYRVVFHDQANDPRFGTAQPRIYVFWHEYIFVPLYLRGNCDLAMLLSRHKDANILAEVAGHVGFDCVRGSTNKGAAAAMLEMRRLGRDMHLTITPDGPRGPRRQLAIGPIYLASRLGLPIVPLGFGVDRPWRMNSWDRFALPRPFSRARGVVGPDIHVPADLNREQLDVCRQDVEQILNDVTTEAEDWATSGAQRAGEIRERARSRVTRESEMIYPSPDSSIVVPLDRKAADLQRKIA